MDTCSSVRREYRSHCRSGIWAVDTRMFPTASSSWQLCVPRCSKKSKLVKEWTWWAKQTCEKALLVPVHSGDELPSEACSAALLLRSLPPPRLQDGLAVLATRCGGDTEWRSLGVAASSCHCLVADQNGSFLGRLPPAVASDSRQMAMVRKALESKGPNQRIYGLILMGWEPLPETASVELCEVDARGLYGTCTCTLHLSTQTESGTARRRLRAKTPPQPSRSPAGLAGLAEARPSAEAGHRFHFGGRCATARWPLTSHSLGPCPWETFPLTGAKPLSGAVCNARRLGRCWPVASSAHDT